MITVMTVLAVIEAMGMFVVEDVVLVVVVEPVCVTISDDLLTFN